MLKYLKYLNVPTEGDIWVESCLNANLDYFMSSSFAQKKLYFG